MDGSDYIARVQARNPKLAEPGKVIEIRWPSFEAALRDAYQAGWRDALEPAAGSDGGSAGSKLFDSLFGKFTHGSGAAGGRNGGA